MSNPLPVAGGRRRGRRHWQFVIAVLAGICVGQEFLFRLLFPLPEVGGFNRVRYQKLAPGDPRTAPLINRGLAYERVKFESLPDGFSEIHRLNVYGFRGGDFSIEPKPGRRRILMLGDSFVEGQGAPERDTIPSLLTGLLASDGTPAEVINLGVVAASLTDMTLLARDAVPLLHPQDVILVLYANDLPALPYPRAFDEPGAEFPRQVWPAMPRLLDLLFRVANDEPIYRRWPPRPVISFFQPVPDGANPWTEVDAAPAGLAPDYYAAMREGRLNPWLWQQARVLPGMLAHNFSQSDASPIRYFERIAALCQAENARLLIAYVPFCGVVDRRYTPALVKMGMDPSVAEALCSDVIYRRQNELLGQLCGDMNLSLADTTDALKQAELGGIPQFWDVDTHPRPAGYATIAGEIYGVFRRSQQAAENQKK